MAVAQLDVGGGEHDRTHDNVQGLRPPALAAASGGELPEERDIVRPLVEE